jgi:hypothetical protein
MAAKSGQRLNIGSIDTKDNPLPVPNKNLFRGNAFGNTPRFNSFGPVWALMIVFR